MDAPRLAGVERTPDRLGSMFSAVSWRYDLLNTLMSVGQDGAWRRALAAPIARGERVLDLCCGSARSSVPAFARSGARVTGVDVSFAMLERGKGHARHANAGFDPVHGDGFRLPFRDGTFDVVCVAFGLRNLVPLEPAAREIARVLRPSGRLLALDSVAPAGGPAAPFHAAYLRLVVPALGLLSPDPGAYRYLSESIFDFGSPDDVCRRLEAAGFARVVASTRMLGAVALFEAHPAIALSQRVAGESGGVQTANRTVANAQPATSGGAQPSNPATAGGEIASSETVPSAAPR
jgi:demethylmenaquinone methyltransferase/2-methoxy-6-polyprenyl-1,4-benzoquinol methylase